MAVQHVLKYGLASGNKLNAVVGGDGDQGGDDSSNVAYSGTNNSGDFSGHGGIAMDSSDGGNAGNAFAGESVRCYMH